MRTGKSKAIHGTYFFVSKYDNRTQNCSTLSPHPMSYKAKLWARGFTLCTRDRVIRVLVLILGLHNIEPLLAELIKNRLYNLGYATKKTTVQLFPVPTSQLARGIRKYNPQTSVSRD